MCRSVSVYLRFINETESRTLPEYLNLFNRCACMDAVLAIVYAVDSFTITSKLLGEKKTGLLEQAMALVTLAVLALFIIDGMLVLRLRGMVVRLAGQPHSLDSIIQAKRMCVLNGSVALTLYTVRFGIELLQLYDLHLLDSQFASLLFLAFILVVKSLRILALNSFSRWARMFWAPGGAAGGVPGASRAPLQAQMAA